MYGAECTGGSCVSLTNTQQGDAGAYTCTADNGVGAPHAANIFLTVQYPPQISSSQDKQVQQHQGEVRLECEVEGEPKPVVTWHKNTQQVFPSNTVKIKESEAKNYLVLLDASSSSSFGNYSCLAKNILGEAKKYIEVHGRPSSAVFSIMDSKPTRTHYYLVWDVKSPTPILEYRLLYRKIIKQGQMRGTYEGDDWTNVIIPGDQFNTGIQTQVKLSVHLGPPPPVWE
ncbi:neuronal growth regulator 1 [Eurytemora carolleeae]|uniref:neuronal growth regulator 1 n=1 Tax=Eurytemora carolleeae TaxID=1294199 RepID=UPI000C77F9D9|nr:neuronal growth regulator 1 [Eurytemora carolleeae]|eukprot:XP_023345967.1 neuronal growth regulator 1-like [Eurytemora affinis]